MRATLAGGAHAHRRTAAARDSWDGAVCLAALLLAARVQRIRPYVVTSHKTATDLEVEALFLTEKAKDLPLQDAAAIEHMKLTIRQALEYEQGKGNRNRFPGELWGLLDDPDGSLLGEFLKKWETTNQGKKTSRTWNG